jgi:lysozyme
MRTRSLLGLALFFLLTSACGREDSELSSASDDQAKLKKCVGSSSFVQGIDVSEWQESVDWKKVAADGYKFAYIRSSYGSTRRDYAFEDHWQGAKAAGLVRGTYQYFLPNQDPVAQVDTLVDMIGGRMEVGDLPPVLDVEDAQGLSAATLRARVKTWVDTLKARLGVEPVIYSGIYFWRDYVNTDAYKSYKLWLPYYSNVDQGLCPEKPTPWGTWNFWQWTDSGRVAGIAGPVDLNVFRGTLSDLQRLTWQHGSARFTAPLEGQRVKNPVSMRTAVPSAAVAVRYSADGYILGTSRDAGAGFVLTYKFNTLGVRVLKAAALDADSEVIAVAAVSVQVTL